MDPSLAICVTAIRDAYVPREGVKHLAEIWPGSEVRYIDAGHVTAFLFNQASFRLVKFIGFSYAATSIV